LQFRRSGADGAADRDAGRYTCKPCHTSCTVRQKELFILVLLF